LKNLQSIKSSNEEFVEKVRMLKMPIYRCTCGVEILVLPDLAAMNRAIERHIGHHNRITGDHLTEEALTMRIIKTVAKMAPSLSLDC
jgi:hypothetical protein